MIIWFHNNLLTLATEINEEVIDFKNAVTPLLLNQPGLEQSYLDEYPPQEGQLQQFTAPSPLLTAPAPKNSCTYPIRVEELFPYWLKNSNDDGVTQSNLVLMTKSYYDWLTCGITANDVSFLNLEALIDIQSIPDKLIKNQIFSYINSFPQDSIKLEDNPNGIVEPNSVRNLYDNVKVNLYTKKGTEESFKFVLESLFGISASNVSISYPKRFVMRLNGGKYDWMRDDTVVQGQYSLNPASYNPQLVGSFLNYSILQDSDLWQDYSYVLNISGLSSGVYSEVVRPLVHPAGTKDFYDVRTDIFNNITDNIGTVIAEIPVIGNYAYYNLFSYESLAGCCGCSGISGSTDFWPSHAFPTWDLEISQKYPIGVTFGSLNIVDFLRLNPSEGVSFPNELRTCNNC